MGILSGKDLLSSKFVTAEISDSNDRIHYVPIKHTIGDYFVADLDGQLFAFTLKNARILTHYKTMTKSFRVVQFDTCHYSSLKPETKELEIVLKKNALPTVDRMLYDVLRVLGRREKEKFEKHSIDELIKLFGERQGEFPEQVKRIKGYMEELDVKEIVSPVRRITDFIHDDLIATSPSYLGGLLQQYHRVQGELRMITNRPEKPTTAWMKVAVIILIIGMGGAAVFIAYDNGAFDGISDFAGNLGTIQEGFKGLPAPGQFQTGGAGADYSDANIQSSYPDCDSLTTAINAGTIDYNKLSSNMKSLVDSC